MDGAEYDGGEGMGKEEEEEEFEPEEILEERKIAKGKGKGG